MVVTLEEVTVLARQYYSLDPEFALIAFNMEQILQSNKGGYVITKRKDVRQIAQRLRELNVDVLNFIIRCLESGEHVVPSTEEEKKCYRLINDIDGVSGKVEGSTTSKKQMCNKVWALIAKLGSPSWFITMSPADVKHPLCLHFSDTNEEYHPDIILPEDIRKQLIAQNPIAAARFFHVICEAFIKHVLGVGTSHDGLY
ncbi:hypothetical protein BT96DRAFT_953838 [Gymnopus androsaceus JB14]|uniref:Helitron helicase-like domain-containing protein n=1 Tax=Gymnopus androsaceus JB14 TaxID=1447944 RepID=A0A6A4IKS9_9AGAR|nr:hypothetical protein BT96DRAFT_953838 [Gymnopus androsaceus JB14]